MSKREKCYIVEGQGVWLGAYAIVFAIDEAAARDAAMSLFTEHGLDKNMSLSGLEVREVPKHGAHLVWNGDY